MSEHLDRRLKAFTYHRPSLDVQEVMNEVRRNFQTFCTLLDDYLPESREKSLALTALEECSMWGMKALSHNDSGGEQISP